MLPLVAAALTALPSAAADCARPLPPAALPEREVVATTFSKVDGGVWSDWEWGSITTVVDVYRFGNETPLVCRAHSHGARLLYNFGDKEFMHWGLNRSRDLHNATAYAGVAAALAASGADGLLVDVESNAAKDPSQQTAARTGFTLFMVQLRRALLAANPAAVLAFAATGYPDRPDSNKGAWPHFDLPALANTTDYFYVMAYGTDAFRDNQTAHSNAQLSMLHGLVGGYPKIGVPLHHLVLGLPWQVPGLFAAECRLPRSQRYPCPQVRLRQHLHHRHRPRRAELRPGQKRRRAGQGRRVLPRASADVGPSAQGCVRPAAKKVRAGVLRPQPAHRPRPAGQPQLSCHVR